MTLTVLHNPHCPTSVHALEGAGHTVVAILVEHPALLQRPILDDGDVVMIGRPRTRAAAWAATGRASEAA